MKTKITTTLYALCALCLSTAVANADSLTVVANTNATWRAIGPVGNLEALPIDSVGLEWESTNTGWNTSLIYDDSDSAGWHAPTYVTNDSDYIYVWSDGPQFSANTPAYFRTEFFLGGTPTLGLLDFRADDDAQIWINGQLVVNDNNNTASTGLDIDVRQHLRSGFNLIAVKAQDSFRFAPPNMNSEYLALRLDVEFTPAVLTIRCSQTEMCWQSATNVTYQLQYQSALTGGQWTNLGAPIPGDGSRKCVTDAIAEGEPQRFYRTVTAP